MDGLRASFRRTALVATASVLAALLSGATTSTAAPSFRDVGSGHVFHADISWLAESGITTGYSDGSFRPGAPVLREQMAAFLYRLHAEQTGTDPLAGTPLPAVSPFSDVSVGHAFYREIVWLSRSGVTTGYTDGTFRPGAPVLREQVAAFLHRLRGVSTGAPVTLPPGSAPPAFVDVPPSHVFFGQIRWLAGAGITTGYDDRTYRPSAPVLREQMAAFLHRFDGLGGATPPTTTPPPTTPPPTTPPPTTPPPTTPPPASQLPEIATVALPIASVAVPYEFFFTTVDGRPGTWAIETVVPPGLRADGRLVRGTPTVPGSWTITVAFTDGIRQTTRKTFTLVVAGDPLPDDGPLQLVSRDATGTQRPDQGPTYASTISADGRHLVFSSKIPGLVPGSTYRSTQVFSQDRITGEITLVSRNHRGRPATNASTDPSVSADGRYVVYSSLDDQILPEPTDANRTDDIYLWDRETGSTTLVSRLPAGTTGDDRSRSPRISADGAFVVFESEELDLTERPGGSTLGNSWVYLWERSTGVVSLLSANPEGYPVAGFHPTISADGAWIAFAASTLITQPQSMFQYSGAFPFGQVYLLERSTGELTRISNTPSGSRGNRTSGEPEISADGSRIAFLSNASDLTDVPQPRLDRLDVFLWERSTGSIRLVSQPVSGPEASWHSIEAKISADGRYVAYTSAAQDIVPADYTWASQNVLLWDSVDGSTQLISRTVAGRAAAYSLLTGISADGSIVTFTSDADDLVPNDVNKDLDLFVWDRSRLRSAQGRRRVAFVAPDAGSRG